MNVASGDGKSGNVDFPLQQGDVDAFAGMALIVLGVGWLLLSR